MTSNIGNQGSYDYTGDGTGVDTGSSESVDSSVNAGPLSGTFTDQVATSDGSSTLYFNANIIDPSNPALFPPSNDADYNNANILAGFNPSTLLQDNLTLNGNEQEYSQILQQQDPLTAASINQIAARLGISPLKVIELIQDETLESYTTLVQDEPKEDQQPLLLAFFKPDAVKDKRILDKKNQLLDKVNQQNAEDLGFTEDWDGFPPSNEKFNKLLNNLYDMIMESIFENSPDLQKILKKKTPEEVLKLKTQFKMGTPPSDSSLVELLHQLNLQAREQFYEKYGLQSFDERNYSQGLLQEYRGKFSDALNEVASLTPPLSQEQINAINQYFLNPNATVPPDIKQIAEALKASAIQKVPGLSGDLDLSGITISIAGVDANHAANLQASMKLLDEAYNLGMVQANAMPDGADKENYFNFLSQISLALIEMHKMTQQLATAGQEKNRIFTQINSDYSQNQMERDKQAMLDQQEKMKKMANMKGLNEFGKWMMVLFAFAMGGFTGGASIAAAIVLMADLIQSEVKGTDQGFLYDALDDLSDKLDILLKEMFKNNPNASPELKGFAAFFKGTVQITAAVLVSGGNPVVGLCVLLNGKKTFIDTWNKSAGGAESVAMWTKMGIQLAIQVIAMVVMMIVTLGAGSSALPGFIGQIMGQISSVVTQAVGNAVRAVMTVVLNVLKTLGLVKEAAQISVNAATIGAQVVMTTADLAMALPGIVAAAQESRNNKLLADIDKIKGDIEKFDEMIKAIMEILKKTIQILQESNSKLVQFSLDIAHTSENLYSTQSDVLTGLANSQRG